MSDAEGSGSGSRGSGLGLLALIVIAILLAINNPSEADMRQKATKDGWVPVSFERTNLIIFSFVKIQGFTGEKKTYFGVAGQIF
jgi:hypothetical protein